MPRRKTPPFRFNFMHLKALLAFLIAVSGTTYAANAPQEKKTDEAPIHEVKDLDKPAVPRVRVAAKYPSEMKNKKLPGRVLCELIVDNKGDVVSVVIKQATNEIFAEAARKAAKQWKFYPGEMNGKPAATRCALPIIFTPPTK